MNPSNEKRSTEENHEPIHKRPFPSTDKIPFPYPSGPYPQQAALMDTMLRALQVVDLESASSTNTNSTPSNAKVRGRVMMLESPTGTGKSLSLACAGLTWLRHTEICDLENVLLVNSAHDETKKKESKTGGGFDWLDSWENPDIVAQRKEDQRQRESCHQSAKWGRDALQQKLTHIRNQIQEYDKGHHSTKDGGQTRKKITTRIRLTQEAISSAQALPNKKHSTSVDAEWTKGKRKRDSLKNVDDDDFCLDEYKSDDDVLHPRRNRDDEDDSSSSENGENLGTDENRASLLGGGKKTARQLLSGGYLDGSNVMISSMHKIPRPGNSSSCNPSKVPITIGNVDPGQGVRKIIYAARTHSQLSQFISELLKTKWGRDVRVVALGSRKMLCGNTEVTGPNRIRSEAYISEKCLDMQKGVSEKKETLVSDDKSLKKRDGKGSSCPLLSSKEAVATLALHMLAEPSDIEDLATIGQATHTCAYYASRESLAAAEVVVTPYSILLSKKARESIGLSLAGNLVLIDEAHNIPEALRGIHSSILSMEMIDGSFSQISAYLERYSARLAGRNLFYVGQIRRFLTCSKKFLTSNESSGMMSSTEFLFKLKLDNLNMFKIVRFFERTSLSRKLLGFRNQHLGIKDDGHALENPTPDDFDNTNQDAPISKHVSCMSFVESFMRTLTYSELEGKIVAEWPSVNDATLDIRHKTIHQPRFRYVLLNPALHFKDIVKDAHAVVLTAGTLRPFSHLAQELLSSEKSFLGEALAADRMCDQEKQMMSSTAHGALLTTFTCSHVVPPANVHLRCISYGPSGIQLDFRHESRLRNEVCDELAHTLLRVCESSPEGLVIFLPSYSYEAHVFRRWKSNGLFSAINKMKPIYREPSSARDVESILESYTKEARTRKGAALFCVINGKMSEGINFSDERARCVVVVGLPYPDLNDPVLKEKMKYMDEAGDTLTGKKYYHALCMRSLGQAIGRSIRHANDFAAILLVDARYSSDSRIWEGLPNWLKHATGQKPTQQPLSNTISGLEAFFQNRYPKKTNY